MNALKPSFLKTLLNRFIIGVILFFIAIPAMILGGWFLVLFTLAGLILAVKEVLYIHKDKIYPLPIRIFIYVMAILLVFWIFIYNNVFLGPGFDFSQWSFALALDGLEISTVLLTIFAGTLFFSSITDVRFKVGDATYLVTLILLITLSFQGFLHLRFFPIFMSPERSLLANSLLLIYVTIATFTTDIGAYLIGSFFGKHKMNIRVSANKTWEGFFGGVVISFVLSFAFAFSMDLIGFSLLPFLTLNQWYFIALLSLLIPLVATFGDFTFSIIKREFGLKHFSLLLGEHGGVLDRIDSFMMAVLFTSLLVTILYEWSLLLI